MFVTYRQSHTNTCLAHDPIRRVLAPENISTVNDQIHLSVLHRYLCAYADAA